MSAARPYELLTTAGDVTAYLAGQGLLGRLAASVDQLDVDEVTAGNMNRVFVARGPLGSLAVKQAPPWVQVVGPEWPVDPSRIASEARTYERLAARVPESIPTIVAFDESRFVLVMEDLSDLDVLRDALVREVAEGAASAGDIDYAGLGAVVGRFVGSLAGSTSVAALGAQEHERLVELAANPELCQMTLDVVLDEPYREHDHNHWHPALDERVRALYADAAVREAVGGIREVFETRHEALLHGDLHTGSVMVGRRDGAQVVKVFDPEFSFVGPIGLDLGLLWANLELGAIAAAVSGLPDLAAARYSAVASSWAAFAAAWGDDASLAGIERDAWRFAGVESMRRAAGFSHAADIDSLPADLIPEASVRLFDAARHHILTGAAVPGSSGAATGAEFVPATTVPQPDT
ncbi:phosphotransferase [Herbiconiux ginsengi]|uniref:5'-methylthioribose kinase n=1 Tax=Herbiconiux ginsengi TaxID=381665 RepID=A0A1H3L2S9_9MICO|nr:phosphotransferase [Herbiconiux ginsengi]SDY58214.1 5'-methylthioribose kinase [Herbiconiux ginsengi]